MIEVVVRVEAEIKALSLWAEWFAADGNPIYASECGGDLHCFFCGGHFLSSDDEAHTDDCIYVRAQKLLAEGAATLALLSSTSTRG